MLHGTQSGTWRTVGDFSAWDAEQALAEEWLPDHLRPAVTDDPDA